MNGSISVEIHGTKFNVEYDISGFCDEAEIEEMKILVGDSEICADCLDDKVLKQIDDACFFDFWNQPPEATFSEPEMMEDR